MKKHLTRIIGIILLIIGILAYISKTKGGMGIGLAGLILLIAPTKHGRKMLDVFVETFSKWKVIIITALYDALYYLLTFGAAYFYYWRLQTKSLVLGAQGLLSREAAVNPELSAQAAGSMQSVFFFIIIGGILLVIFSLLIYVVSRGMIWTTITKQKPNKKFFKKFLALNSLWWLIWLPILAVISIGLKDSPYSGAGIRVILVVAAYFTVIVHTLYMQKHLIGYSISNGLGWGIGKVHRLIVPYTFAFVLFIIIYQVFKLFQNTAAIKPVSMIFIVLFVAWLRIYLYEIIKEFK